MGLKEERRELRRLLKVENPEAEKKLLRLQKIVGQGMEGMEGMEETTDTEIERLPFRVSSIKDEDCQRVVSVCQSLP
jgi:hypothetical protein